MSQNQAERQNPSPKSGPSPNHRDRPTLPPIIASEHGPRDNQPGSAISPGPNSASSANADLQSSRSLRMHSILNHSSHDEQQSSGARSASGGYPRSVPENPSGPSGHGTPVRNLPPMAGLPPLGPVAPKAEPPNFSHRSHPPGTISLPAPSSDARKSPFPSTTGTPQAGTPPISNRVSYPFPHQGAGPTPDRRGSESIPTAPASQSNSPTTSYSSYGQTTRNSPTSHYQQPPAPFYGGHPPPNGSQVTLGSERLYKSNPGQGHQSTYQMMTLDTDQGPIQVPVDVQAASKMADEKRKRNAGASARFRQRRKEKEREATMTISKLETKLRLVGEEKEYYRMERDYFRGLVYNSPAQVHVTPRLPSPRQRQLSDGSNGGSAEWLQNGERGSDDGRNQRRRISSYESSATPAQVPGPNSGPTPHVPQHGPGPYQYAPPDARQQSGRPPMPGSVPQQMSPYGPAPPSTAPHQPQQQQQQQQQPPQPPPQGYDRTFRPPQ